MKNKENSVREYKIKKIEKYTAGNHDLPILLAKISETTLLSASISFGFFVHNKYAFVSCLCACGAGLMIYNEFMKDKYREIIAAKKLELEVNIDDICDDKLNETRKMLHKLNENNNKSIYELSIKSGILTLISTALMIISYNLIGVIGAEELSSLTLIAGMYGFLTAYEKFVEAESLILMRDNIDEKIDINSIERRSRYLKK